MSEPTSPPFAERTAEHGAPALTGEVIDAVLADFRSWLHELASGTTREPAEYQEEPLDLHTLLGQFSALRHEVNLQTKAVRAQQEQNAETLRQLDKTVTALDEIDHGDQDAAAVRPLLKALVDTVDALALARQGVERLEQTVSGALLELGKSAAAPPAPQSFWARWQGRRAADQAQADRARQLAALSAQVQQLLESVLTGYRMGLQRLERTLEQQGLEPIACVGATFDPEQMEVVEAVAQSDRPAGEVLGVARGGYLLNGRVFRYAQVRVAK